MSDGFLLAGGGCGGGPRLTDDADEMDDPDVEPLRVFCFQEACVAVEGADSVDGVRFNLSGPVEGALAGPRRPRAVAFNVGIPPVYNNEVIREMKRQLVRHEWIDLPAKSPPS